VSNTGGVSEIIDPEVTAVGVAPRDIGAMAHAISVLVSDDERRARLGAAARPAVQRFSRDALVQRLLPLYDDAVASRDQNGARVPVNVS
jgi:glycosyltransferase involved in cell wall biosynthesis